MLYPTKLFTAYKRISNCNLVKQIEKKYEEFSQEDIDEFADILNSAKPTSLVEAKQHEMIQIMYEASKTNFRNYISDPVNKSQCLILWLNAIEITSFFDLKKKLYVGYDYKDGKYNVSVYTPGVGTSNMRPRVNKPRMTQVSINNLIEEKLKEHQNKINKQLEDAAKKTIVITPAPSHAHAPTPAPTPVLKPTVTLTYVEAASISAEHDKVVQNAETSVVATTSVQQEATASVATTESVQAESKPSKKSKKATKPWTEEPVA